MALYCTSGAPSVRSLVYCIELSNKDVLEAATTAVLLANRTGWAARASSVPTEKLAMERQRQHLLLPVHLDLFCFVSNKRSMAELT